MHTLFTTSKRKIQRDSQHTITLVLYFWYQTNTFSQINRCQRTFISYHFQVWYPHGLYAHWRSCKIWQYPRQNTQRQGQSMVTVAVLVGNRGHRRRPLPWKVWHTSKGQTGCRFCNQHPSRQTQSSGTRRSIGHRDGWQDHIRFVNVLSGQR